MIKGKDKKQQIEILAPAGSYESFQAAIQAGADAVYAGGPRFGARAFADNFTKEQLMEAIDYAHLHSRKLYLTVNTLLKDEEIQELYEYLEPLYRQGLDAVIVQDVGVLEVVRTYFPDLAVHASTQMTITNAEGALFLKELGAERVVPARELSLEEVKNISDRTKMEIECFVHGALCYCYSGQCLLSSLIGGRSGNRGQCAQPCRLPFTVNGKKEYVLSLKDICTLELIPELIEAGIDSFKIEGRMKKPEYVALVTSMYRKYVDLYIQRGNKEFQVSNQDKEMLMDIYNRGGFSEGYYRQHNGRDMISLKRSNHAGVPAVRVFSQKGREINGVALTDIHKGDIVELGRQHEKPDMKENYTFGKKVSKGAQVQILVPKGKKFEKGMTLYRLRNQALLDNIQSRYGNGTVQEPIIGILKVCVGEPACLTVSCRDVSVTVAAEEVTQEAKSQPLDSARLRKQLQKTGNTEFYFETIDITVEGSAFLPMQRINELRRHALELLKEEIWAKSRRKVLALSHKKTLQFETGRMQDGNLPAKKKTTDDGKAVSLSVLAETKVQLEVAVNSEDISRIYVDSNISSFSYDSDIKLFCKKCKEMGKEFFLAMPHIFRKSTADFFSDEYQAFLDLGLDGVLIRNYESFYFLKERGFDKKIILDHNLYVFNQQAEEFWKKQGIHSFTAPVELNEMELDKLGIEAAELIIYGRIPVMVSAQCIAKTTHGCSGQSGIIQMKDRYQKEFPVRNCCNFCYNIVYNSSPLFLADLKGPVLKLGPSGVRIQFTCEDAKEAEHILKICGDIYHRGGQVNLEDMEFTRGHFKRGIT